MAEIIKLGKCPVCEKGEIIKGSLGYTCNYFKNVNDKCGFNIYHTYFKKTITDEIAIDLINKGETEIFHDLVKKDESIFSASLKIEDGLVKPNFKNKILDAKCPACGGEVQELLSGYACENYLTQEGEGDRTCAIFIPKVICGQNISPENATLLLKGEKTNIISGFKNGKQELFSSRLVLKDNLNVTFNNDLCECPKCGTGTVYIGTKAYNCSNQKKETNKCDFVIWKEIAGRQISAEEAITLCQKKETPILSGFKNKEGETYDRKLIINEEYKIKIV
ncbi:DNA topoisomerase I [Bacteroidia bacterium]|nr:DNA topoisomerase I [Bacteroidia bacterium]GHT61596.1 DNA topoisomerase I [Bacteroidia bacterium]